VIEPATIDVFPRALGERCLACCLEEAEAHPQPSAERGRYENIGANDVSGGWRREWTSFGHARLLGFIHYGQP
jgi:hypothetical protein